MDSWTLQGDSYSFLRSAPRTFSLCHRDGTPNHVEIFDIINVPNQSSAISETTCLCDIFGDDCESPSLSSSPAVGRFIPPQREVEGTAAASPPVDDLNDSSGSYHTAHGSSEGEEGFDDSGERLSSPTLESEDSQRTKTGGTGHSEVSEDSNPNLEPKSKSPLQHLSAGSPSSEALNTGERTPPPGHKSPLNFTPARSPSSSSSSVEKRCSPLLHNPRQANPEAESSRITPTFKDKKHSDQDLTSSTNSLPRNCATLSAEPSNTQSFTEVTAQASPEPISNYFSQYRSPPSEDFSSDFSEPACKSRTPVSSPLSSFSGKESSPHSRGSSAQSYTPDTPASSPFQELTGRISLPDLFSRGSTPDREASIHSPSTTGREITTTLASQNRRPSTEPLSTVSTPAPQYTPPSPISRATYPELVESRASSEIRNTSPSPCMLSAASPIQTGTRSPSPAQSNRIRQFSTPGTQVSSPVISYSLSPSPEVTRDCSPTAPSPEIRITASSPDANRREWLSEVKSAPASPLREFALASSRSPTSSPHITGISYCVVQPEDRDSPPFPELQCLSTPEPDRTLSGSPEAKSLTQSRDSLQSSTAEPSDTRQDTTHISGFSSPIPQPRYHTPSPRLKHLTPSPEVTYQTTSTEKYHSPSPQDRSKDPSSVVESHEQQFYQPSPSNLCSDNKRPSPLLRNTPDVEENKSSGRIRDTVLPAPLEKQSVSPSFTFNGGVKSENKSLSPVVAPVTIKPEEEEDNSLRQSLERDATPKRAHLKESVSLDSFSEELIYPSLSQKEEPYHNPLTEIKSSSPDLIRSQGRSPNISTVHKASSITPLQGLGTPLPKPTSYSLNSPAFTPGHRRKLLPTIIRSENRDIFTEDMAHHANRRQTPSPPLTRFTPVHIIAPEKPYRQWQNRSHSPSQFVASSNSGNLKKVVTNRENPNVALVDNNSQAHWVSQGTQLEMEKQMQLEEVREVVRERLKDREIEKERKREEQVPEKGKGWQGDATYRGEQAELSFNARNRKGPVSCRTAPTSREIRQALPTVHSYSESLLATRRLQQHSLLASQQDHRGVGSSRRQQPPAPQNRNTTPRRVASNRPGRSSSSSMGSELDETDNEVKWFTDVAFSSLSSPEADYLDMYNSSHHSSTNISQSSTQESPAGVNAAWPAYADFRGSAQKLDSDDLSFQQPYPYYSDGLDPSRRYELGSFECVDVAMEREDHRKVRRGVPKRQIQLKRKNAAEVKQDESSENSSPGAPVMVESSSFESHSSETFMRQQITPASMEECYPSERSPEPNQQNRLQKSASLDESCAKTKMANCLIQSVLSKKIQSGDKQQNEQAGDEVSPSFEETAPPTETLASPFKESPKPILSSSLQSDFSVSSEGLSVKGESNIKGKVKMTKNFGVKPNNRPSSSSSSRSVNFSQTESEDTDSDTRNATPLRFESKSEKKSPCDYKHPRTEAQKGDKKTWDETEGSESANASEGNTGAPSVTGARTTNRDQECENTEDHKQLQQGDKSAYTSSTPEITMKAVEKKKASLNVCLTPEADDKPEGPSPDLSFTEKEEREEASADDKIEEEEANGNSQVKVPIHKVRDVRRLVKNTYNLSFKATGAAAASTVNEEQMQPFNQGITDNVEGQRIKTVKADEERREDRKEEFMERKKEQKEEVKDSQPLQRKRNPPSRPQPMQIEYRAVCSKDGNNKISCTKSDSESLDDKSQAFPKLPMKSSMESQMSTNANSLLSGETAAISQSQNDLNTAPVRPETVTVLDKVLDNEGKPIRMDRKPPMLGSLPRQSSKEREVSTAVVLIRDGSSKTKTTANQEEVSTKTQAPAASPSPGPATSGSAPGTSGHSVSMLLKEKGYQADIGAVVGDKDNGFKGVPCKHVNSLEIPLQATASADEGQIQSHRERTFSASSNKSAPSAVSENTDILAKTEDEGVGIKPTVKDPAKQKSPSPFRTINEQAQPPTKPKELDFEAVKRLDPTFPPRSPAVRRFRPQAIEVKSLSKDTQKQETPTNATGNNVPQTIEVKSIAKNSQKPIVPPKPTCKFKPADLGMMPNEAQRPSATSTIKPQGEERSQTIVVSSPTIYRKISSDSTSTSHSARKLAVSAVSSIKPPSCKTASTTISSLSNQPAASFDIDTSTDGGQQPGALPQSSGSSQRATTLAAPQTSATGTGSTSDPSPVTAPNANLVPAPVPTGASQPSQPAVVDQDFRPPHPRMAYPHEQAMPAASNNAKQPPPITTTQVPGYTHQTYRRSLSGERPQRTEDMQFYASDDPPSYDDRESFSPLMLPDLTTRRSNRYQPSTRPPPCSCTTGCPSHPGITPPHYHRSPHNLTPPAPTHSPGQALPYPVTQPPLRPHQCRPDPQPMTYQPSSPKSSPLGPSQPPAVYQSLHPPPGPPHPSLMHACPAERSLQPSQHIDLRRAPVHRSPQQQPPGVSGAPYSDPVHGHSPALPPMDPQYLCGPQSLGPSYGSEYGGDTSSLYSESSYGQAPRRVLLDPETGKYFYIEVPVQPLRKMLYDPETGQYVEVLIPQQAMSHSGLYPPSAAPYPSLHNSNMYAPAPQYMPYAAPPPPAHPQTQPQPPRYPEPSAAAAPMHPSGPGVSYRNPSGQGSKPEPQNHPPLDQSYLESMYYVPTGMNASPNPTPPDYYHKHPPNLPPTGGKRS